MSRNVVVAPGAILVMVWQMTLGSGSVISVIVFVHAVGPPAILDGSDEVAGVRQTQWAVLL